MEKKRVLVIDDEQIVLDSAGKILTADNYDVDVTRNASQGLEWALSRPYDIVLTDIRMPETSGMVVLRDIKRAKPSLPVVIITGYGTVKSAVQAMKLGAADYIEKPFTPDGLVRALSLALDTAATRQPESQALIHKKEMLAVLERAATDKDFVSALLHHWADALEEYHLTGPEQLALLTGDLHWIERHAGPLTEKQKQWLEKHHFSWNMFLRYCS